MNNTWINHSIKKSKWKKKWINQSKAIQQELKWSTSERASENEVLVSFFLFLVFLVFLSPARGLLGALLPAALAHLTRTLMRPSHENFNDRQASARLNLRFWCFFGVSFSCRGVSWCCPPLSPISQVWRSSTSTAAASAPGPVRV